MSVTTEVLRRARRGDERAFAQVVDAYGGLVLNVAFRMSRDRQEAEDLAQEVFLRLFRVFPRYDPERPFTPWLRRVTTNLLINLTSGEKRRRRRQTASLDSLREAAGELPEDPGAPGGPSGAMRSERAEHLNRAILCLKPEQRAVLALHYYEGRSYEQIAEDLALPLGTVKNRLFRARESLARALGGEP
jgi:RNA polymerase sigma-70 factor (ECF subfamily)